jgi:hypothetical protein
LIPLVILLALLAIASIGVVAFTPPQYPKTQTHHDLKP